VPAPSPTFSAPARARRLAAIYFAGFDTSTTKPSELLVAQYNARTVAAYLRSAPLEGMTLAAAAAALGHAHDHDQRRAHHHGFDRLRARRVLERCRADPNRIGRALASTTCTFDSTLNAFVIKSPTTGRREHDRFRHGEQSRDGPQAHERGRRGHLAGRRRAVAAVS
jgi:hypothetical protein